MKIHIALITLFVAIGSAYGQIQGDAINIGSKSSSFVYIDTQNTKDHYDYTGSTPNEVYYSFELKIPMNVIISHCGSVLPATTITLIDSKGYGIAYDEGNNSESGCSNALHAYLRVNNLPAGTYYIMSEGAEDNGYITTKVEGITVEEEIILNGNTLEYPIDLGVKSANFTYTDTKNTSEFTDNYQGRPTSDIFYKFTLSRQMDITVTLYSGLLDTYLSVLNPHGVCIGRNDDSETKQSLLEMKGLGAGTYYVVVEGYANDMNIKTYISGVITSNVPVEEYRNYISTITPTVASATSEGLSIHQSLQEIQYYDGLGRPVQHIHKTAGLVTHQEYDEFGRLSNMWLPIPGNSYKPFVVVANRSQCPYSTSIYEHSAMERITELYGPGEEWRREKKSIKSLYYENEYYYFPYYKSTDNRAEINFTHDLWNSYLSKAVSMLLTIDEDGNAVHQYKDSFGQLLHTRQRDNCTNYIYDSYGNLRVVLPPLASESLSGTSWGESNEVLQKYAYLYKYDERNRCTAKKLPGADWIYYIYDKADRLIFTQDGTQRTRGEWAFTIPDAHGRIALSGTCTNSLNYLSQLTTTVSATWANTTNSYKGYTINGIILSGGKVLTVNYYDLYDFMGKNDIPTSTNSDFMYETVSGYGTRATNGIYQGLHTGTLIALLDDAGTITYLPTVMYYDNRGRMVQSKSKNHLTGGIEKEYILYTFTGKLKQRKHIHSATGKTTQTEFYAYTYDHAERLTKVEYQLQVGSVLNNKVALTEYTYDELGRQQTKGHHGNTIDPITYAYNIRSWLTGITHNKFNQNLYYNTGNGTPLYNGNISSMTWKAGDESTIRGYKFAYDGLNRLTAANYGEGTTISTNPDRFTEKVTGYDKHGNITGLQRYGKTTASTYGLIDNLSFGYAGNRMKYVNDAVSSNPVGQTFHFANGSNSTGDEYAYDANGNMTKDLNKNITDIQYNLLNLPKKLQLSTGGVITYTYDAAGVKRNVTHQGAGVSKTTDYCGNVIYENGAISKILTNEGYITLSGTTPTYHYYLKDHLGNNRVVLNQDGTTVEQVNHYYPFGGLFDQTSESLQAYKYNGKELDRTYGIDLYDYSARFMDGAVGRFTTMDPMAEKYYSVSPYLYCGGNPVIYIDPDGKEKLIALNPNDPRNASLINAANKYEDDGAIHVWAHGNSTTIFAYDSQKKEVLQIGTGRKFETFLNDNSQTWKNRNGDTPIKIILHSCETGQESKENMNPIARQISKELKNTVVIAPSGEVAVDKDNNEMGSYSSKTVTENGRSKTVRDKEATWNIYSNNKRTGGFPGSQLPKENMPKSFMEKLSDYISNLYK